MSFWDWMIVLIPMAFVMYMGYYSRRYIKGVADFLSAGRICGRYVISVGDVANGLAVIGLVAFIEAYYKTGIAVSFWSNLLLPLTIVISLTGYCVYRFRETRALSLGQFLEMRYNRPLRIFAAALRSLSEMLANMICPAIAARFFIYYLDLPHKINLFGLAIPTFMIVILICLTLSIAIIWMGGMLALVITDTIQGLFCYPMLVVFVVFILVNFSWSTEIVPTLMDRTAGESFLNPYDVEALRDFNLFAVVVSVFNAVLHKASWLGGGNTSAARTPHEQKMAGVLGSWRNGFSWILYLLLALMVITLFNHQNFAPQAREVRAYISDRVTEEIITDPGVRQKLQSELAALPVSSHTTGVDAPLSQKVNLDTPYLETAMNTLSAGDGGLGQYQEFRTLYHQVMLPGVMRKILPVGLIGLFGLMMVLMMISTDDSRIFSASRTITQDVIMPLCKKAFDKEAHFKVVRWVTVGVGMFFFCGSFFMSQLDYINLFVTIMTSMWLGGCGPVMIFGLYSKFGTTAGAFASLISGMVLALGGILIQRNWADHVYPWLDRMEWADGVGAFLSTVSAPFNPIIVWEMNPVKFPINSIEIYFMTIVTTLIIYCVVSWLTCKEPFNLDRMLHRGKYNIDGDHRAPSAWSFRSIFGKLLGITPEYSRGDKVIAWSVVIYMVGYKFFIGFVAVILWNMISPWPVEWWGTYFFVLSLVIPGIVAAVSTIWFSIGGTIDLLQLFRDLKNRIDNPLDDGRVEGHISLADKAAMDKIDQTREKP